LYLTLGDQTMELQVNTNLITMVYIQYTTLGFTPQLSQNVSLQVQKFLYALFSTYFSCVFHINALSKQVQGI
jgi:hypothetical protein